MKQYNKMGFKKHNTYLCEEMESTFNKIDNILLQC